MSVKTRGFAHPSLDKEAHIKLSSEGGRKKNPNKGFGSLSKSERSEQASRAAKAKWDKVRKERQADESE